MNLGKVAFIYCGGGYAAAYGVGFTRALLQKGIKPEFVQGISAGALTAAKLVENNWDIEELVKRWLRIQSLGQEAIFNRSKLAIAIHVFKSGLFSNQNLRRMTLDEINFRAIVKSPIEFQVVTQNKTTGLQSVFSNRDSEIQAQPEILKQATLASNSISGFFPPVFIKGEKHSDGDVMKISEAVRAGCHTIFILNNSRVDSMGEGSKTETNWFSEAVAQMQQLGNQLLIRKIEWAIERGYALIQNNPSSFFEGMRPLQKIRRRINKFAGELLEDVVAPRRIVLISPSEPIPTFNAIGFREANPRTGYPGDIVKAIERAANDLNDEFWAKL